MSGYRHADATLALMQVSPVIPVLTVADAEDGVAQARALAAGGLSVIEVTLRTRGALHAIAAIRVVLPHITVGAGTVLTPVQIKAAVEAGAAFLVSPGMTPHLAEAAARSPVPFLPGVATAGEAMQLMEHGFRAMKFFPAEPAGGARYLAALAGPLAELRFCPTGGIDAQNAKTYLAMNNVACVGGSWMLPAAAVQARDFATVERLAREAAALRTA